MKYKDNCTVWKVAFIENRPKQYMHSDIFGLHRTMQAQILSVYVAPISRIDRIYTKAPSSVYCRTYLLSDSQQGAPLYIFIALKAWPITR